MDSRRWKKIEEVYLATLEAPDRSAFLDNACGEDVDLRRAVDLLLKDEVSTKTFFGRLARTDFGRPPASSSRVFLEPGSDLGPYRIVELLGSGGSSDVYKASDTRLDRYVALKVFSGSRVTEEFRSRFAREYRAAASLNHPNIATVYEVGEADSPWFIAMEYIDGTTLRPIFADPARSLVERLAFLAQAADALARAHGAGIAHCDVKPDNIMVTRDGLVKVLDFGLVRSAAASNVEGMPVEGTIGYMSPEQVAGQALDARSDVFSFGCVLFEAATNKLPFSTSSVPSWIDSLMFEAPPRLATLAPLVPARLQELVTDCLVKDPASRSAPMEDVSRRLRAIIDISSQPDRRRVKAVVAVGVAALTAVAYWQWPAAPPLTSVAVLPFISAPSAPAVTRLADGISEGLINSLIQLPELTVIARSSSFRFRDDPIDALRVAETLGVRTLVTGRVVERDGQLTVTAELIDGRDGTALWGAEYTPSLENIADVETQIAREIARRVRSELTPTDQRRLDRGGQSNAEAYSLLLRGRYELSLYSAANAQKALSYFEQALGLDPSYALANAELAKTYRALAGFGVIAPDEAVRRAEQAALRALATDAELPEAHYALAGIRRDRWQWADAEREYRRAVTLSPSFVQARQSLAAALTLLGRNQEAIDEIDRVRELDPVSLSGAIAAAAAFYNLRLYPRALTVLKEASSLDGLAPALWTWTGIVTGGGGDMNGAITALEKAIQLGDTTTSTRCYYIHALAKAGRQGDAMRYLRELERERPQVPPSSLAIAYLGIGDRDRAIAQLQAGYAARDPSMQYIAVESYLDALAGDPRFQEIVTGMGLPSPRQS